MEAQGAAEGVPIVMRDGGLDARCAGPGRRRAAGDRVRDRDRCLDPAPGAGRRRGRARRRRSTSTRTGRRRRAATWSGPASATASTCASQPALDGLADLEGVFDLAFLDAIKSEYAAYADLVLPLLRPGGMLVIDNSLMGGNVAAGERISGGWRSATSTRCAS